MDSLSQDSDLFSQDLFSQYDDNFASQDCVEKFINEIDSNDAKNIPTKMTKDEESKANSLSKTSVEVVENTQVAKTPIVPVFGKRPKQAIAKKDSNKKPKTFTPPVKKSGPASFAPPVKCTKNNDSTIITTDGEYSICSTTTPLDKSIELLNKASESLQLEDKIDSTPSPVKLPTNKQKASKSKPKKRDFDLGDAIFGSLNVLNDEEWISPQNCTQATDISDASSVKNLSETQNMASFCSVTSLNKTYKNMDVKSSDNVNLVLGITKNDEGKDAIENSGHKIPVGDEFLKLFQVDNVSKQKDAKEHVAMSTELGDMGLNRWYRDFIKEKLENKSIEAEEIRDNEQLEAIDKILEMYPKENEHYIRIRPNGRSN
ncbi:uncharacterized protein LOC105388766 [Plutella xylostella]|uniref:uncharacterized protein LOC105388766 n=1 Tax=Plutella xylostella TaxID=51655 RepID=UPI002032514D|nr:uncharacterized protein LOC105388766 [Plutella xylostella]